MTAAHFAHPGEYPLVVPLAIGILAGAACGAVNGGVVTLGRVAPFIATLGMLYVARGLALLISGGATFPNSERITVENNTVHDNGIAVLPDGAETLAEVARERKTRADRLEDQLEEVRADEPAPGHS